MTSENLSLLMRELRRPSAGSNLDSSLVRKKRGANVFKTGDKGRFMFVVIEGVVEIKSNGRLLATVRAGDTFGEMALIHPDSRRTADAVARDDCELMPVHQQRLLKIIEREPEVAIELLRVFVSHLTEAIQNMKVEG